MLTIIWKWKNKLLGPKQGLSKFLILQSIKWYKFTKPYPTPLHSSLPDWFCILQNPTRLYDEERNKYSYLHNLHTIFLYVRFWIQTSWFNSLLKRSADATMLWIILKNSAIPLVGSNHGLRNHGLNVCNEVKVVPMLNESSTTPSKRMVE
jgi:hypothetical protein